MNLFVVLLFCLGSAAGREDEWVSVAPSVQSRLEETLDERDLSSWVVLIKQLGDEKFFATFPRDPVVTDLGGGSWEIVSGDELVACSLQIYDIEAGDVLSQEGEEGNWFEPILAKNILEGSPDSRDRLYYLDGKWVCETAVQSKRHLFLFQTKSGEIPSNFHQKFLSSFRVYLTENH